MPRFSHSTVTGCCTVLFTILLVAGNVIYARQSVDPLAGELHNRITRPDAITMEQMLDWSSLEHFYIERNFAPVWLTVDGPNLRAIQLCQTLHVADQEGLDPTDYHIDTLAQLRKPQSVSELAALDIYLTDAFFRYALDVSRGRYRPDTEDNNGQNWHITPPAFNMVDELQRALKSKDFEQSLQRLPPPHSGYQRLREALAELRHIAQLEKWPVVPPGPSLREGMRHPQVPLIRQRLLADGSLEINLTEKQHEFDQSLSYAVQHFQVRHGLAMDGVVGPATRAAMNASIQDRMTQIRLNMERWRWLPRKLGRRYIIVNSAAYNLTAIEDEQIRFTMWVVIGKEQRQTPVIAGGMHTLVFNPYWTVPIKLVFEDLIPRQLRDSSYLRRNKIRVMRNLARNISVDPARVDWQAYSQETFPYVLRQDPGPDNPLGRIKFLFSNDREVYLHDTPKRDLFDKDRRAFSAGCIRLENPLQLADFVLTNQPNWDLARIREAMKNGQNRELELKQRLPVYLLYLTSWVGEDGSIYFYEDVYGRDQAIKYLP